MRFEMAVVMRGNAACWVEFSFWSTCCFVDFGAVPVLHGPHLYMSLSRDGNHTNYLPELLVI